VDKSLLRQEEGPRGEPRFVMLETIHEYARERLVESGERAILRARHAAYFRALAAEQKPARGVNQDEWLDLLQAESTNVREALDYLEERGEIGAALELALGLHDFWHVRGYNREHRMRLERLLGAADQLPRQLEIRALVEFSDFLRRSGERHRAFTESRRAVAMAREVGDRPLVAETLGVHALSCVQAGHPRLAEAAFDETSTLLRGLGQAFANEVLEVETNRSELALNLGDWREAERRAASALELAGGLGDQTFAAVAGFNLALARIMLGRSDDALPALREVAAICIRLDWGEGLALCAIALAAREVDRDDFELAARLLSAGEATLEASGATLGVPEAELRERTQACLSYELDSSILDRARHEGLSLGALALLTQLLDLS
jgi:tetratricopeptide (TPR) repeat protein